MTNSPISVASTTPSAANRDESPNGSTCEDGMRAEGSWRTVEIFVPSGLGDAERAVYIDAHVRAIAHDGGEFIHGISLRASEPHTSGWGRCQVAYLSGPPGLLA